MKPVFFLMLLMALMLLSSCQADLRELCYDHSHMANVSLNFQWPDNEEAAAVKGMTALFYPADQPAAEPIRYDFSGRDGGSASLSAGNYRVIAYNNDTESILYRGTSSPNTLEAYTRRSTIEEGTQLAPFTRGHAMPRAAGTENEPIILDPDLLWAADESLSLSNADKTEAELYTAPRVIPVEITITGVPNLQYSSQFGGTLSGLAASVMMDSGEVGDEEATQAFTAQVVGDSTLWMRFNIFGHCPHRAQHLVHQHQLTIYAVLADGSKWYYTQDVSNQMHDDLKNPEYHYDPEQPEALELNYEIDIDLDELPVPKPIVNGSGFQPTIDGWQSIEIPVEM